MVAFDPCCTDVTKDELLYTKSHEWVRIKSYEDSGLGDLEEVSELPEGDEFTEEQREAFKKEQEQKFAQEKKLPVGIIGITDIAQERLGDLVFIDFPKFGAEIGAGNFPLTGLIRRAYVCFFLIRHTPASLSGLSLCVCVWMCACVCVLCVCVCVCVCV